MPDREKYIEILSKTAKTVKEFKEDAPIKISLECIEDILELLKAQEPVDPTINEYGEVVCGNCGENVGIIGQTIKIVVRMRYCPECGKAVNWKAVKWG